MAKCFCGCGRGVKLKMRPVNKRGKMIAGDIAVIQDLLDRGVESPNADIFVADGQLFCDQLADAVHDSVDPGDDLEYGSRQFMAFARNHFSAGALGRAVSKSGMSDTDAVAALRNGTWDPFADVPWPE